MRICFIVGAGRSGTTLAQALLDCHPECAVWPFELSFQELWLKSVEKGGFQEISSCKRFLLNNTLLSNSRVQKLGEVMEGSATVLNTSGFNKNRFINHLRKDEDVIDTPLTYLAHLGKSFRVTERQQVFVMRHNDLPHDWYHENLATCTHIIMLRNPIENYLAYQRFRIAGKASFIHDLPFGMLTQFSLRRVLQGFWAADRMHSTDITIRLEDVSASTVSQMNYIAELLHIKKLQEWKPSILGNSFSGNSTRGKSKSVKNFTGGYSQRLTKNEHDAFKKYEHIFIKYYPGAFKKVDVVSDIAGIEKLFHARYADGINSIKNHEGIKWFNVRTNFKIFCWKNFNKRMDDCELRALMSMDALLPDIVDSPSWRNTFG